MSGTTFDPMTKIWSGPRKSLIFHPDTSVGEIILYLLNQNPNKISQISDDTEVSLTNRQIAERSVRIAQFLQNSGFECGDTFGIIARNSENVAPVLFAGLLVGAKVNALNTCFTKEDINHMFGLTKPKVILCDSDVLETVQDAMNELMINSIFITCDQRNGDVLFIEDIIKETGKEDLFRPCQLNDSSKDIALILCSSGTTGKPKGVAISYAQVLESLYQMWDMNTEHVVTCFSQLYWISGIATVIFGTISGATRVITQEDFKAEILFKIVEKYKVTHMFCPTSQIALILQSPELQNTDFSSVEYILSGGSPIPIHFQMELDKYLPNGHMSIGYGMSERCGVISLNKHEREDKVGSAGSITANASVKIINAEGNKVGPNDVGEICFKTFYSFLGYYGNPEATAETLDSENWIHSGDIGYIDDDGYIFIIDRKKEILKFNGFQISPSDIENVIACHNGVGLVCVVGIPDPISCDLPAALIVRSNSLIGAQVTAKEIFDLVAEKCTDYKKLRGGVYFVDEIPLTPSGKFLRRKAKDIAIQLYNNTS